METLNKVELRGRIGQDPKILSVGDTQVARFSVATSEVFHDREGMIKEETTWHNVAAWQGKSIVDLATIKKGQMISLTGRIRSVRYTATDGSDKYLTEIVATQLSVVQ